MASWLESVATAIAHACVVEISVAPHQEQGAQPSLMSAFAAIDTGAIWVPIQPSADGE